MRKKTSIIFQQIFLHILPIFFLATLTKCQQAALGRVKITTECAQEQMTLHVQLNESFLPSGHFTDWIIVGTTTRPECRLKGNGELRYIVQIAVLKDPCATKMTAPGVFQNTLRIASFPGLILSDDLNFEFKCALGLPEVLELRLPQTKASESENNEQIVPIRPPFSTTTSSSSPRSSSFLITGLGHNVLPSSSANAQQQFPPPPTNLPTQQTQRNKFVANSEVAGEEMSGGNAWTQQNGKVTAETEQRRREGGDRIGTENLQRLQLGAMDGSYHTEALNLEPPSVPFPAVPLHSSTNSNELHHPTAYAGKDELRRTNSMKAFGGNENGGPRDNETNRGEFNAAACRSITEIYRTAEMKLKSMMQESEGGGNGKPARGGGRGEYSTPKKLEPLKERGNLLISCVNKIRGYGSRKLTEQEILRWRQLIRNDANFQNRVFESVSEEDLMRICELPQYRVLFTKLKWIQIMGCIAEEILDSPDEQNGNGGRQRNDSTETVRRMKPLPALPGPSKFGSNAAAPSQLHKAFNHPNASLKIFVGNVGGVAER
uniref:ZP domain-containing protein n=1 Tax=Globodera pallida TaxID=36090 RepID=A0A183C6G1_GLOPA